MIEPQHGGDLVIENLAYTLPLQANRYAIDSIQFCETNSSSFYKWRLKRHGRSVLLSLSWKATFLMALKNTGQGNPMNLDPMMITIRSHWRPSGWIVLDSLKKVRLQSLCLQSLCSARIFLYYTTFVKNCRKICFNKSIAFPSFIEPMCVSYAVLFCDQSRTISHNLSRLHLLNTSPTPPLALFLLAVYCYCFLPAPLCRGSIRLFFIHYRK